MSQHCFALLRPPASKTPGALRRGVSSLSLSRLDLMGAFVVSELWGKSLDEMKTWMVDHLFSEADS